MRSTTRVIILLTLGVTVPLAAQANDSEASFRKLSAQWWQWALSIPATVNPVADLIGAHCMVGQRGSTWFLAGTVTGRPVVRTCTIPEGVDLFFPVLNVVNINSPGCDQPPRDFSAKELREAIAPLIDGASNLSVLLNNVPVRNLRRVRSEVFPTVLPEGNLFGSTCVVAGQVYSPSVDDGYYVRLRGLSAGQHSLRIRGTNAGGFSIDVSYTLNVVRANLRSR